MSGKNRNKNTSILYGPYIILGSALFTFLFPAFWLYSRITGRYRRHLGERLGFVPHGAVRRLSKHPRIWIHAVSLGEVQVAASIIEALKRIMPGCSLIVSTVTEHGRDLAVKIFGEEIPVVYAPVDLIGSVRIALSRVRPHAVVFLETEIWPAWLFEAHRMGIKTALINGRISTRAIKRYLGLRPFFKEVLKYMDIFSMLTQEDAARITAMGGDPRKIEINGNAKYDLLRSNADPTIETEMRRLLNLEAFQRVFIAGSTRDGEESMVMDAYERIIERYPDTILIIAPRHIGRTPAIGDVIEARGHTYQVRTDLGKPDSKRTAQIVIINTFGDLFKVYSIGTVVFCGGSLVPLGGQNPLEPAVWGKTVFYGPSMENFGDATALLEAVGAGIRVSNPEILALKTIWFFGHPKELASAGARAREAVLRKQGAAEKHAQAIKRLLKGNEDNLTTL